MKQRRLFLCVLLITLVYGLSLQASPSRAQGDESPHAAIVAKIPTLLNFAEQAETTLVGEVETSYAYIAFVVQDNLVVIYVCDSVEIGAWINTEIVDGVIRATHDSGIEIVAAVSDNSINGTISLPVDDDGSPIVAHDFATAPAVPGVTGLARYSDDLSVRGWIVTEHGIRGVESFKGKTTNQCANMGAMWQQTHHAIFMRMIDLNFHLGFEEARNAVRNLNGIRDNMIAAGCTNLPQEVSIGHFYFEQP